MLDLQHLQIQRFLLQRRFNDGEGLVQVFHDESVKVVPLDVIGHVGRQQVANRFVRREFLPDETG